MSASNHECTLGIVSSSDAVSLTLVLTSVLTAAKCPRIVFIYLTAPIPPLDNFYLAQLSALARFKKVEFVVSVGENKNIRESRDYLLEKCQTPLLWMLDDDVIVDYDCYIRLFSAMVKLENCGYLNGVKGDVTNRRGYQNFELRELPEESARHYGSFNHFYVKGGSKHIPTYFCNTMDTGNVLIDRVMVEGVKFSVFPDSTNCGGEDALFGLQVNAKGHEGRYCPSARAYHLEKPKVRFDEFSARAEAMLRSCDLLGLDKEAAKREMMSWCFQK